MSRVAVALSMLVAGRPLALRRLHPLALGLHDVVAADDRLVEQRRVTASVPSGA